MKIDDTGSLEINDRYQNKNHYDKEPKSADAKENNAKKKKIFSIKASKQEFHPLQ